MEKEKEKEEKEKEEKEKEREREEKEKEKEKEKATEKRGLYPLASIVFSPSVVMYILMFCEAK